MIDPHEEYEEMIDQANPALVTLHKWIIIGRGSRLLTHCPYKGYSDNPFIVIRDCVWIGYNCIIQMGVTLNHGCLIGAGSVVTKDCNEFGIYVGNPAKFLRNREGVEMLRTFCAKKMAVTSGLVSDHKLEWGLITDKDIRMLFKLPRKIEDEEDPGYLLYKHFQQKQNTSKPNYDKFSIWEVLDVYGIDPMRVKKKKE